MTTKKGDIAMTTQAKIEANKRSCMPTMKACLTHTSLSE
jgi:hypothetical protein